MKYVPTFFKPWELVPEGVFARLGSDSLIVMDDRILISIDNLRKTLGKPVTVNNWHEGGTFGQRGFRDDVNTGAPFSQHRYGRGIDFDVAGMTASEVRSWIVLHQKEFPFITRMERDVKWVHIDCAGVGNRDGILLFRG